MQFQHVAACNALHPVEALCVPKT
ncbi:MAG: hypothetical protein QOG76_4698, partial [Pseudonocardiales bacterium]|nr:hypothetical protein [Pseudonocardiales bacterium]